MFLTRRSRFHLTREPEEIGSGFSINIKYLQLINKIKGMHLFWVEKGMYL